MAIHVRHLMLGSTIYSYAATKHSKMFHAIANSLNKIDGLRLSYLDIRRSVVDWLRDNEMQPNGVFLPDFVHNQVWDDYLFDLAGDAWGDHLTLLAVTNIYNVDIRIVSSVTPDVTHMNATHGRQGRIIYLGHESEFHYHRLDNMS